LGGRCPKQDKRIARKALTLRRPGRSRIDAGWRAELECLANKSLDSWPTGTAATSSLHIRDSSLANYIELDE